VEPITGKGMITTNAVCIHEEDNGVLWKHKDWRTSETQVRRGRRLVVSFFCTIANYEYGFYYYFSQVRTLLYSYFCFSHTTPFLLCINRLHPHMFHIPTISDLVMF
jgi:hypothetical protein